MNGRLAIFGGGGHGRVVADCALACGWSETVIFDDDAALIRSGPWAIAGTGLDLLANVTEFDGVIVAIGNNSKRLDWHQRLLSAGSRPVTLIHPAATVSPYTEVGLGSVVLAAAVVTIGAVLGDAVIVNNCASVNHDCVLDDAVHVAPGAHLAGGVRVGHGAWVGLGAVVREYVTIGNRVFIGAGSIVVRSVDDGLTVMGNPARPIQRQRR